MATLPAAALWVGSGLGSAPPSVSPRGRDSSRRPPTGRAPVRPHPTPAPWLPPHPLPATGTVSPVGSRAGRGALSPKRGLPSVPPAPCAVCLWRHGGAGLGRAPAPRAAQPDAGVSEVVTGGIGDSRGAPLSTEGVKSPEGHLCPLERGDHSCVGDGLGGTVGRGSFSGAPRPRPEQRLSPKCSSTARPAFRDV